MELTNNCFSQKWEIVRPGAVSPLRHVPDSIPRPPYVPSKKGNLLARDGDGRPTQPEVTLFLEATCSVKSVTLFFFFFLVFLVFFFWFFFLYNVLPFGKCFW